MEEHEILKAKQSLPWSLPALLLIAVGCYFLGLNDLAVTINDLIHQSPIVRISTAPILTPLLLAMSLLTFVGLPLKAVPALPRLVKGLEIWVVRIALANFLVLVTVVPASPFLQNHFMPQMGYSKCNVLQGHPTIWFNDWIKEPAWCVDGKDRAWVLSQARRT
ncbi:hypothetical protein M4R22_10295 [Acidovorax sp. GBBC 3334]|uniref:hypothetical protein n=1 Tax=Acidovorax sp. GBBC 3334 TaxID=2940496 RepID=UPI002302E7D0|nr:hypothetical protein [Acidovorax sp. GBBC 3334]MDA8455154.1 hypothetical protein [Acidovorax sp. GBBC 3334]